MDLSWKHFSVITIFIPSKTFFKDFHTFIWAFIWSFRWNSIFSTFLHLFPYLQLSFFIICSYFTSLQSGLNNIELKSFFNQTYSTLSSFYFTNYQMYFWPVKLMFLKTSIFKKIYIAVKRIAMIVLGIINDLCKNLNLFFYIFFVILLQFQS